MMEMDVDQDHRLRESGLAFFGRITASVSHDINNVLSTIGEYSGLLQDFILVGRQKGGIPPERLQRMADGLATQVQKGAAIVKRLNRFAHTTDEAAKLVNVSEFLELIVALAQRFAGLKQIPLETDFTPGAISIQTNPFLLQQAVFTCIDLALSTAQPDQPVAISTAPGEPGARITIMFSPGDDLAEDDQRFVVLSTLMSELGGTSTAKTNANGHYLLTLQLPQILPS